MRKALVVGGANGIGLSIALQLASGDEYGKVYVVDRAALSAEYAGEKIEGYVFDLTSEDYSFFEETAKV